jgi:hypothetical protein
LRAHSVGWAGDRVPDVKAARFAYSKVKTHVMVQALRAGWIKQNAEHIKRVSGICDDSIAAQSVCPVTLQRCNTFKIARLGERPVANVGCRAALSDSTQSSS